MEYQHLDISGIKEQSRQSLEKLLAEVSAPPLKIRISDYVDGRLTLPDGPYVGEAIDLSRTPYLREILDRLSLDDPCNIITFRKSAQVGYTTLLLGVIAGIAELAPQNTLLVLPTIELARDFNREKLQACIDGTPDLKRQVKSSVSRSGEGSTTLTKRFQKSGFLVLSGANSSNSLSSKTIKFALCDETDRWPEDLDNQGSPMKMVQARQMAFRKRGDYKLFQGSTPTVKGNSQIDDAFDQGDQREYQVPCPVCGVYQPLEWERLTWQKVKPHNALYECAHCGELFGEHQKPQMLAAGEWVPMAPGPGKQPSYQINALYSPFVPWDDVVHEYLAAQNKPLEEKAFHNLWLGRAYEVASEAPAWESLRDRAKLQSRYLQGSCPTEALVLTAGVDINGTWAEMLVVGWGVGETAYVIDRFQIPGRPEDHALWATLTEKLYREYITPNGQTRRIERLAIDTGHGAEWVRKWARGKPQVIPVKGASTSLGKIVEAEAERAERAKKSKKPVSQTVLLVGTDVAKEVIYGKLNYEGPDERGQFPPGYIHFPGDLEDEFFDQLTAEVFIETESRKTGQRRRQWKKRQPTLRNEVLDCFVYALAAAYHRGLGMLTAQKWADLSAELSVEVPTGQMDLLQTLHVPAAQATPIKGETREERAARFVRERAKIKE